MQSCDRGWGLGSQSLRAAWSWPQPDMVRLLAAELHGPLGGVTHRDAMCPACQTSAHLHLCTRPGVMMASAIKALVTSKGKPRARMAAMISAEPGIPARSSLRPEAETPLAHSLQRPYRIKALETWRVPLASGLTFGHLDLSTALSCSLQGGVLMLKMPEAATNRSEDCQRFQQADARSNH